VPIQITVVGQGYVGLPLANAAAISGYTVFGLDNNHEKIRTLSSGKSIIEDLSDQTIQQNLESRHYIPTTNSAVIKESDVVLICVPTPLSGDHKPDPTALIGATVTVGKNLKAGVLVIVESTIEPGTCRNIILPILIKESGLTESDFELAYSPERIDPTNKTWQITNTPKLVAGFTESAANKAKEFYGKFIDSITLCSSLEIAETAKLLENSYRLINISFINELAIYCQKIGISIVEVVNAAATKPYGFMPFFPSIGAGGHCIPVDPIYLANAARAAGTPIRFIGLADEINLAMPSYFVERAEQIIGDSQGKKILIIGLSYKPNVADVRESPVISLINRLTEKGAQVSWHDDLVKEWNGKKSVALSDEYDLAILATPHDYLDLTQLGDVPILNTRDSI